MQHCPAVSHLLEGRDDCRVNTDALPCTQFLKAACAISGGTSYLSLSKIPMQRSCDLHKERENRFIRFKCERAEICRLVSGVRMFFYSDYFVYSHTSRAKLLMT
jgi:hypothetical protein